MGKPRHSRRRRKAGGSTVSGKTENGKAPQSGKPGEPQLFETPDCSRRVRSWRCPVCDWRGVAVPDGDMKWVFRHTDRKEPEAFTLAADNVALVALVGVYAGNHREICGTELERRG